MKILSILRDTLRADIYDLNFSFSSEQYGYFTFDDFAMPRRGVLIRIGAFLEGLAKHLTRITLLKLPQLSRGSVVFFVSSKNQVDTLSLIARETGRSVVFGMSGYGDHAFPMTAAYFVSLLFFPLVLYKYVQSTGYRRESFRVSFDWYWLSYGLYFVARILFNHMQQGSLVVANDHSVENRTIAKAARDEGLKTFFVQHASVTQTMAFPALSFDYAMLDGLDALKKYDALGRSSATAFLVGLVKLDPYARIKNQNSHVEHIGICLNTLDPFDRVFELCTELRQKIPSLSLSLRPHPADKRHEECRSMAGRLGIGYSDPKEKPSFEFLGTVDAIVAGESNIHLEAVLVNAYPIRYDFARNALDVYGFLNTGLVDRRFESAPELVGFVKALMNSKPDVRSRAQHYRATVGTDYEGRSVELVSSIINQFSRPGGEVDETMWVRVVGLQNLTAYELRHN